MKNKLYFLLILFYALMAGFILYINGVFTGQPASASTLLINGGFLILIAVIFAVSITSFVRLNGCTAELVDAAAQMLKEYKEGNGKNLWVNYQDRKELFTREPLKLAYAKYRQRMRSFRTRQGYSEVCDIEEYINADLIDQIGLNFFNSGVSGTMTGLGILGTFLGLSMGLSSFNGNDIYTISDNVGPLLTGMKVAFHTSVYGIFFSLVFNFVYRSIMSDAYGKLEDFLTAFRQCVEPKASSEEENTAAMLVYQANLANSMKQLLDLAKGESKEQTAGLERIVGQFMNQMNTALSGNFERLGVSMKEAADAQTVYAGHARELTESSVALLKECREIAQENKALQEQVRSLSVRQEELAKAIDGQKQTLESTCRELTDEISNQLFTFDRMRELYEK